MENNNWEKNVLIGAMRESTISSTIQNNAYENYDLGTIMIRAIDLAPENTRCLRHQHSQLYENKAIVIVIR